MADLCTWAANRNDFTRFKIRNIETQFNKNKDANQTKNVIFIHNDWILSLIAETGTFFSKPQTQQAKNLGASI